MDVVVRVKRFQCKECGAKYGAKAPFYEGCGYAAPVVNLCLAIAANMPANRGEALLAELGIQVDRDTIRKYYELFWRRAEKYAGLSFTGSNLAINVMKILTGAENAEQLKEKLPAEEEEEEKEEEEGVLIAGVADETQPHEEGGQEETGGGEQEEEEGGEEAEAQARRLHRRGHLPARPEHLRLPLRAGRQLLLPPGRHAHGAPGGSGLRRGRRLERVQRDPPEPEEVHHPPQEERREEEPPAQGAQEERLRGLPQGVQVSPRPPQGGVPRGAGGGAGEAAPRGRADEHKLHGGRELEAEVRPLNPLLDPRGDPGESAPHLHQGLPQDLLPRKTRAEPGRRA